MPRKKAENPAYQGDENSPYLALTPNQVVAYNLARARELKGWSQDQAAAALEPWLGVRWSKASFSQAERSLAGKFIRNFTADEIVAFARAFGLPVTWFFMPPPPWAEPGVPARLFGTELAPLIDLVFGDEEGRALLDARLNGFIDGLQPLTTAQQRIAVDSKVAAPVRQSFAGLEDGQVDGRSIANQLTDLETPAKSGVEAELGVAERFEAAAEETEVSGVGSDGDRARQWQTALRSIAHRLEDLKARAKNRLEAEFDLEEVPQP